MNVPSLPPPVEEKNDYEVVRLKNGIFSLRSHRYGETYHPVIGPGAEAKALYVEQLALGDRLQSMARQGGNQKFCIWDVGLGAAANILTVLAETSSIGIDLEVFSFDFTKEPLKSALQNVEKFPYLQDYQSAASDLLTHHHVAINQGVRNVSWNLVMGDFPSFLHSQQATRIEKPHLILFDAFSPKKNPEMWTLALFERLHQLLDPDRGAVLPTYSRSTLLRTTLLCAGFYVGFGSRTGEKEETTVAANAPELIVRPLGHDWLQKVRNSTSAEPLHGPEYQQKPLTERTLAKLMVHPQFR